MKELSLSVIKKFIYLLTCLFLLIFYLYSLLPLTQYLLNLFQYTVPTLKTNTPFPLERHPHYKMDLRLLTLSRSEIPKHCLVRFVSRLDDVSRTPFHSNNRGSLFFFQSHRFRITTSVLLYVIFKPRTLLSIPRGGICYTGTDFGTLDSYNEITLFPRNVYVSYLQLYSSRT